MANEDGTLFGMMSREDIASYNMELNNSCILDKVPLFNVLSVLEGKVINEAGEYLDTVSGEVILAIPESRGPSLFSNKNSVVICGNQPDLIRQALERNVSCLVLCRAELDPDLLKIDTKTCIISTPLDAYRATRLIFQSTPVGRVCRTKDLVCFHLHDRLDDVKELVLKYRESCYPVLDENEKIVGVLTHTICFATERSVWFSWTTMRPHSLSQVWRKRRSWRSLTITAWLTSRPTIPFLSEMSL